MCIFALPICKSGFLVGCLVQLVEHKRKRFMVSCSSQEAPSNFSLEIVDIVNNCVFLSVSTLYPVGFMPTGIFKGCLTT